MLSRPILLIPLLLVPLALTGQDAEPNSGKYFVVYGSDPDVVKVRLKQSEAVGKRFEQIFGAFPGKGAILAGRGARAKKGETTFSFWWPERPSRRYGHDIFPHELGHKVFEAFVRDKIDPAVKRTSNYGSALPDWIDEVSAILHDPQSYKDAQRRALKKYYDKGKFIRFKRFFTMKHPSPAIAGRDLRLDEADMFYGQCIAVLGFFLDEYNPGFIQEVTRKLCKGKAVVDALPWLKDHKKELRNPKAKLPTTIAELESAWEGWADGWFSDREY